MSKIQYLVLTIQNTSDTTIPLIAPRTIVPDPEAALRVAYYAREGRYSEFVSQIVIYELPEGSRFDPGDFAGQNPYYNVYMSWRKPLSDEWVEKVAPRFKSYVQAANSV